MSNFSNQLEALVEDIWAAEPLSEPGLEQRARLLLLDTVGCAVSGLAADQTRDLAEAIAARERGPLVLPGIAQSFSTTGFLTAFGAAACTFEAPEGLASAQGRPGLHVVPAVLAHAGTGMRIGRLLDAIAIGYEIGGRVGQSVRIRPGMHVDGTWGTFAAAAAVARLEGFGPDVAMAALEIAACQIPLSLYHPIIMGSNARNLYVGHGAGLASTAVMAAAAGIAAPKGAIAEYIKLAMTDGTAKSLGRWHEGDGWLLARGYLKKYPMVRHAHYGVEAALHWRGGGGQLSGSERICLATYANAITYCGVRAPRTAIQAQFSMSWGLAWALVHGRLGVEAFLTQAFDDARVRDVEAEIEIVEDRELTRRDERGATLTIWREGMLPEEVSVSRLPGDPDTPLLRGEVEQKFRNGTRIVIGAEAADALVKAILDWPAEVEFRLG